MRRARRHAPIRVQATGQPSFRLLYQGGDTFLASFDTDVRVAFGVTGGAGRAVAMTLDQGGVERAPRVP
jgi:hypothetical protein